MSKIRHQVSLDDLGSDRAAALTLSSVSRETLSRLDRFTELLLAWQQNINLIAPSTIPRLWTRHIADSLQLIHLASEAKHWVDLGSGGGFPGLIIGCALADTEGARVHLIESTGKKAVFLREAARELALPVQVYHARIEAVAEAWSEPVDIVSARAVAPLNILLGYAVPFLKKGAKGLFLKGQDIASELTEASKYWSIDATLVPSQTNPDGRIVMLHHAERYGKNKNESIG